MRHDVRLLEPAHIRAARARQSPVTIRPLDASQVRVRGRAEQASGYRIDTDKTRIEARYSSTGEWIGLRSTTHEGHVLDYRLREGGRE